MKTRKETFSTRQPDGTVITTTTHVCSKYIDDNVEELGCGMGTLNEKYFCKPVGIVRIVEIIVGLIIVSLITSVFGTGPFKGILFGQTFLLLFDSIAFCFTFIFLIVFFFNLHKTHLFFWPWKVSDFIFSVVTCVLFCIMGFIEAYYATGAWSNSCNDFGGDGIIHNRCRLIYQWAFASFFCFLNSGLYAASAIIANRSRQYY